MLYKGRLGWVQYIPLKRARFGIKYYMLYESKSGFVCDFIIYTGASTIFDAAYNDLPVSTKVVMTLMKPLLNQGYCLTIMILVNLLLCQCLFSTAFLPTNFWNIQHFKCQYLKKYLALSRKFGIKMFRMCSRNRISLKKIRHFFTHQLENN